MKWSSEAEEAIKELATTEDSRLVVLVSDRPSIVEAAAEIVLSQSIDAATETLVVSSISEVDVSQLGSSLPASDPCT